MPKKKSEIPYGKAELNKIIDSIIHPWMDKYPWLISIDTLLHGLVEQNPQESIEKFMKYNMPKVLEEIAKWLKNQR
jgi:hypothetical protein